MLIAIVAILAIGAWAQSSVSGDITGTVIDPSGAVVPGAKITIKSSDTGQAQSGTTSNAGAYHFALLQPGHYTISVTHPGFGAVNQKVEVFLGQVTRSDIKLSIGSQEQVVEVSAETQQLQVENGDVQTSLNAAQISTAPAAGGDITALAELTPGIQTSTGGGGYGNFTSNGLPANANLFTVNGNDDMDPFLNLNNSGSSNLTLGINELSEATVTTNGYSGEFGRQAGAQLNYTTKSGTNKFHGNAIYNWSGAAVNARDWFNSGPAPNSHDNQFAASVGGPIWKDKAFFFVDFEGLKYKLPQSSTNYIPSPAYQASTLAGLAGTPAAVAFYQNMFNLWNAAPGAQNAVPYSGDATGDTYTFHNAVTSPGSHEYLLLGRADFQLTNKDKVFFRVKGDHGFQPTWTDPISPIFNSGSNQPSYEGQANWTHTVSNNAVNQLILAGSWYTAYFTSDDPTTAYAAFPGSTCSMLFGGPFTALGGENCIFPQGRNVSQEQFVDDFSWTKGKHNLKFGINFRRNNITDFDFRELASFPATLLETTSAFAAGNWDLYIQNFPSRSSEPFVLSTLGFYGQDQWKVSSRLTLTLSLRGEHNANPYCATNCFALAPTSFSDLDHDASIPYNQAIITGNSNAFHSMQAVAWQPRLGFAYTPRPDGKTVVRGGIGFFADLTQGNFAEYFAENSPNYNGFVLQGYPATPSVAGSSSITAAAANTAVTSTYNTGGGVAQLGAAEVAAGLPGLVTPSLNVTPKNITVPKYLKYNLEIQQGIGSKTTLSVNYVGNHGRDIIVNNPGLNGSSSTIAGFPVASIDSRFGTVNQYSNSGNSDYNGLIFSVQHRYNSLQVMASYTWSHSEDDVSNGGLEGYNGFSILNQIDPSCLRCQNWGNSDYDIRHYIQGSYAWTPKPSFHNGVLNSALKGWNVGESFFFRTGLPFSITDGATAASALSNAGSSPLLMADLVNGPIHCGAPSSSTNNTCFNPATQVTSATSVVSNQLRNQNRGPNYFDSDISVSKLFKLYENLNMGIGINAFNVLNHPNFSNPVQNLANGGVGSIVETVSPPTSPFGAFAGAAASGRVVQLNARIQF